MLSIKHSACINGLSFDGAIGNVIHCMGSVLSISFRDHNARDFFRKISVDKVFVINEYHSI